MDIALIAQIATDRRAPFFPYLLKLGNKTAKEAVQKLDGDGIGSRESEEERRLMSRSGNRVSTFRDKIMSR